MDYLNCDLDTLLRGASFEAQELLSLVAEGYPANDIAVVAAAERYRDAARLYHVRRGCEALATVGKAIAWGYRARLGAHSTIKLLCGTGEIPARLAKRIRAAGGSYGTMHGRRNSFYGRPVELPATYPVLAREVIETLGLTIRRDLDSVVITSRVFVSRAIPEIRGKDLSACLAAWRRSMGVVLEVDSKYDSVAK